MAEATHLVLNGKRLETMREAVDEGALVLLAGFGRAADVRVTVREPLSSPGSAVVVERGVAVPLTRPGMVFEVRARV